MQNQSCGNACTASKPPHAPSPAQPDTNPTKNDDRQQIIIDKTTYKTDKTQDKTMRVKKTINAPQHQAVLSANRHVNALNWPNWSIPVGGTF